MRKPRNFDAELKALTDRAKQLKLRRVQQLGELVIATGADGLAIEHLAGAMIAAAREKDGSIKEGWRKAGARFFQRAPRRASGAARDGAPSAPVDRGAQPAAGEAGAQ